MARLLRSYGVSRLRPPAVISPAVTFTPIKTTSTATAAATVPSRRHARSRVWPVPVLSTATVAQYGFITVTLARRPTTQAQRLTGSTLQPPLVIAPAADAVGPPAFLTITLVRRPRKPLAVRSVLGQPPHLPTPLLFTARPAMVALQAASRASVFTRLLRSIGRSKLSPPAVVAPGVTHRPPRITLAALGMADGGQRKHVKSTLLSKPIPSSTLLGVPGSLLISLVRRPTRMLERLTGSTLQPPVVIAPALFFPGAQTRLAPRPTLAQLKGPQRSKLRPPAVTAPAVTFPGARVTITTWRRPRIVQARLSPPTVVTPIVPGARPPAFLTITLVRRPRKPLAPTSSRLQGPTVILPIPPPPPSTDDNWRVKERRRPPH